MSHLDDERVSSATLQAAIAFIDAFEGDQVQEPSASRSSSCNQRPTRTSLATKRNQTKAELQRLRQEVELLEATLVRVKASTTPIGCTASDMGTCPAVTQWSDNLVTYIETHGGNADRRSVPRSIEQVVREFQRRRHSEAMNYKLRALLAKQAKALNTSESLLMRTMTQEDLAIMYQSQQIMERQQDVAEGVNVMAMLSSRLQQLQLDVEKTLVRSGLAGLDPVLFRSQRKLDQALGATIETASTTLLASSLEHTDAIFKRAFDEKVPQEPTSAAGVFPCHLQNSVQSTRALLRRYEEADRVVYLWTSATSFSGKPQRFVDDSMLIIRSQALPNHCKAMHGSLLQFWHRVHVDQHSIANKVSASNQESVLRSQSSKVTEYLASLEGLLAVSLDQ